MEYSDLKHPQIVARIVYASKKIDQTDMLLITKFMLDQIEEFKKPSAQYVCNKDPNYDKICTKLFTLSSKKTPRAQQEFERTMIEYELMQERQHKPMFERIEKFLKEKLIPQHPILMVESEELKYAIFDSLQNVICRYAQSASYTMGKKDLERVQRESKTPFSLGAQREIVITKTLNDDGSYNTSYSSQNSGSAVVYDKNGKVVATVGTGNNLKAIADALYKQGYNVQFFEQQWNQKDANGQSPAQSVKKWVVRTRVDEFGKAFEDDLKDYAKHLQEIPPASI